MKPVRQIEVAEMMVAMSNYSVTYANALLAATPEKQLVEQKQTKALQGVSPEQIRQMEGEMTKLQARIKAVEETYGPTNLNLVVAKGYISSLVSNPRVSDFLIKSYREIYAEFERVTASEETEGFVEG
jgi:hypothetical protein